MIYRLTRIGVHRTALMAAVIYGIFAIVVLPIIYLATRNTPADAVPLAMVIVGPVVYAAIVYLVTAIGCWIYNVVAGWIGGIEVTLESSGSGAG